MSGLKNITDHIRIKFFDSNCYQKNTKYVYSSYFPEEVKNVILEELVKTSIISLDEYILCPVYREGDIQIGVSGTLKISENSMGCLKRELGEELGIIPYKPLVRERKIMVRKNEFTLYCNNIKKCTHLNRNDNLVAYRQNERDLIGKKIYCIIHGPLDEVTDFVFNNPIYRYYSEDSIVGVAILNVRNIFRDLGMI